MPEDPAKDQTSPYQAAELRAAILDVIDALVQQSERAGRLAAERAAEQLPPGSVVLTASDSMTIREAVRLARQVGRLRRLLVAESSDGRGHRYGELLANAVAAFGVPVEVVPDGEIAKRAASADRVWLGADTIYADGGILNGVGSFAVARAANAAGKPVVVIGESAKIDETASPDGVRLPPEMDYVPGELIDVIVTEAGPHPSAPSPRPRGEGECPRAAEVHGEPDQLLPIVPPLHGRVERHPGKGPRGSEAALVAAIAERLIARGEKVSVVESAAGGRLGDLLSDRPGSSAWLAGGILAYSNESKRDLVGVPADTLAEAGTVSAEVALAMAEGARRVFGTAWGVGESGIAGPQTGRRSHKPSGLAYVAVVGPNSVSRVEEVRTGLDDRGANKAAFAEFALRLLQSELDRTIGEVEGERR